MIPGILAFFQALPAFLQLISQLGNVMDKLLKAAEKNSLNQWLDNLEKEINGLEKAKSPEEKLAAATALGRIIRGIGS